MAGPPINDLRVGDEFRLSLIARADQYDGPYPLWHGWAIMEAFLAGAKYARERAICDAAEKP